MGVLLEDTSDIEIHIESLGSGELAGRDGLSCRTSGEEGLCPAAHHRGRCSWMSTPVRSASRDAGFGDFFPATDFQVEKAIHLGGSNGQFDSLS